MKHMKKRSFACLFLAALFSSFVACGEYKGVEKPDTPSVPDTPIDGDYEDADGYFSVRLVWDGYLYTDTNGMQAQWSNGSSIYRANFVNGIAKVADLDGDYVVTLHGLPSNFMYDPNGNVTTNFDKDIDVEVFEFNNPSSGDGSEQYWHNRTKGAYKIGNAGVYTATVDSPNDLVYYHFTPQRAGSFIIETIVDTTENMINPTFDMYSGSFAYNQYDYTLESGGTSSTYTRNVKYVVNLDEKKVGNQTIFAIKATHKFEQYPLQVNFVIKYVGTYSDPVTDRASISASSEMLNKHGMITDDQIKGTKKNYVQIDLTSDGTVKLQTDEVVTKDAEGNVIARKELVKYFEEDDVYRVYNETTGEYDITLFAEIKTSHRFFPPHQGVPINFTNVQDVGNAALRVSDGTEDYTLFIEQIAARISNSEGVYPVTKEVKEFLQKFSISQRYFKDGMGWAETTAAAPESEGGLGYKLYCSEADQWLFACRYYT